MFSLYSKPNIRKVEDLKGKRIGIGAIGDSSDHMLRPVTADGIVNEALQKKKLEFDLQVQGLKEGPSLDKIFDFSVTRKLYAELKGDAKSAR